MRTYIDSGVISQQEERKRLASEPGSTYDSLDVEDLPDLKQEELEGLQPGNPALLVEQEQQEAAEEDDSDTDAQPLNVSTEIGEE
jgi:hypothetical protein